MVGTRDFSRRLGSEEDHHGDAQTPSAPKPNTGRAIDKMRMAPGAGGQGIHSGESRNGQDRRDVRYGMDRMPQVHHPKRLRRHLRKKESCVAKRALRLLHPGKGAIRFIECKGRRPFNMMEMVICFDILGRCLGFYDRWDPVGRGYYATG